MRARSCYEFMQKWSLENHLFGNPLFKPFFRRIHFSESGKVTAESVIETANLAVAGRPFEVVYYPRASIAEFCVKAATIKAAMRIQWCPGMRFKMAFEIEDSSRISRFIGTISSVDVDDQIRWPNSPWRLIPFQSSYPFWKSWSLLVIFLQFDDFDSISIAGSMGWTRFATKREAS